MDVLATLADGTLTVRRARVTDVPALVGLIAADPVSAGRGDAVGDLAPYEAAFAEIDADPAHLLVCLDDADGTVGTLQLTVLPSLGRRGTRRAQLESVHVDERCRGRGYGALLVGWAVDEARRRGCGLVQLTSDASRADAHRFYERLGFTASHAGFKRDLTSRR
ncbi:ribosomal protein S18 acetylase RimI-like enzyme [Actinomycetospora succinea]|uniref:Ribosomal protein S18 acetylase RimI-like enzyme n=1 Tax=Actinomycetospora succinea TaxID=663603 RepID=A0A4R6VMV0_9PSEU|nr:GNAT family N-acetyltransferase [Actinomycetospora succinea]TDQ63281.1 ribosomal protein S18 acetylase RimI-like enzyme [Actinomycetospora succinea]